MPNPNLPWHELTADSAATADASSQQHLSSPPHRSILLGWLDWSVQSASQITISGRLHTFLTVSVRL